MTLEVKVRSSAPLVRVAGKMLRCYTPEYNQRRPHSALSYRPPAPESRLPQIPGPEFYPMEWALNGPKSNLEVGLVPGGKVTAGLMDKRTLLEFRV